jgi:hypothetical protein
MAIIDSDAAILRGVPRRCKFRSLAWIAAADSDAFIAVGDRGEMGGVRDEE